MNKYNKLVEYLSSNLDDNNWKYPRAWMGEVAIPITVVTLIVGSILFINMRHNQKEREAFSKRYPLMTVNNNSQFILNK